MNDNFDLQRRRLLLGSAAAVASTGLLGFGRLSLAAEMALPDYVNWKNPQALIVHSANTLETRRDAIGSSIVTPSDELFIRNNLPPPAPAIVADPDAWTVAFSGVKQPRSLSLGELKRLGAATVASVLQCSGNGRAFFPHGASGTQWSVGAAGCVFWSGVPVSRVIESLGGLVDEAQYMTSTGGEVLPAGLDPKNWSISFQSRLVGEPWLSPYTDAEFERLAKEGKKRIVVITPAFVTDCLETLEEIRVEGAEEFKAAGGEEFTHIPCLNDQPLWIDFLTRRVQRWQQPQQ